MDGDGLADLIKLLDNDVDDRYSPRWVARRNLPSGDFGMAVDTGVSDSDLGGYAFASVALDARGDGRGGLWPKGGTRMMVPNDAGGFDLQPVPMETTYVPGIGPSSPSGGYPPVEYGLVDTLMADLNGDGLRDRLLFETSTGDTAELRVAWSTGRGFRVPSPDFERDLQVSLPVTCQAADFTGGRRWEPMSPVSMGRCRRR
jgi:hypothetical protein